MNTYGLLDFELVDRETERNQIMSFLQEDTSFLWVNGERNTGKSFLINQFQWDKYNFTPIYTSVYGKTEYNLYENIVSELTKRLDQSFSKFILSNYSGLYNIAKSTMQASIEIILKDNDFLKSIFEEIVLLIDKENNKKSVSKVLAQYIKKIHEDHPLVLIFDDAEMYDQTNLNLLQSLLVELNNVKKIKVIIITDTNEGNACMTKFLTEQLPCDYIVIEPFADYTFFTEIIIPKFPNDNNIKKIIPRIFDICKGYPEKLRNIFQYMLLNQQKAIKKEGTSIRINYDYLNKYLNNFDNESIQKYELSEQLILKLLLPVSHPIDIEFLIQEVIFVGEKIFCHKFEYFQIIKDINRLLDAQILRKIENSIGIFSESQKKNISIQFENSVPDKNMINHYAYLYLFSFKDHQSDLSISSDTYFEIYALYSYLGKEYNWIKINYEYGLSKINKNNSYAASVFDRLKFELTEFDNNDFFTIIECYYNNGEYVKVLQLLETRNNDFLTQSDSFKCFFISGKCHFLLLESEKAASCFEMAEKKASIINEQILATNMKIQAYREVTNGNINADNLYCFFVNKYQKLINCDITSDTPISLSGFLRNSVFFLPIDDALKLCRKAIEIAMFYNDNIEEAFAKNNYGYCFIKQNDIVEAKRNYNDSYKILSNLRIHETAYCLNNLAVCDMFNRNYEDALHKLIEAAMVSTSFYANYCIETHILICNVKLNRDKTALSIANNLYHKINNTNITDLTIIRRINMNLCIAYHSLGDECKAIECLKQIIPISKGTLSEYRANYYAHLLLNEPMVVKNNGNTHDTTTEFEPWIIMFSHD